MQPGKFILELSSRLVTLAVLAVAGTTVASSQTDNVLYRFKGSSDSGIPRAGLVTDKAGNLYGTTSGFQIGCGTVFELVKPVSVGNPWTEDLIHTFSCNNDATPYDGLIIDSAGNLYGTTFDNSEGSVFELSPPATQGGAWTETVLHSFTGANGDGAGSVASLIMDSAGNVYGTTENGGIRTGQCSSTDGCGVVFELTPPASQGGAWTETIVRSFDGPDGQVPAAGVVFDGKSLFGTTFYGGTNGVGVVFRLLPPAVQGEAWKENVLYNFTGVNDGGYPAANLVVHGGNLYGTAVGGPEGIDVGTGTCQCGALFELSPPATQGGAWTETTLHLFTGGTDGGAPYAAVVFDQVGNFYTTTYIGGTSNEGTVAEFSPPTEVGGAWTETILANFQGGNDGSYPAGSLIFGPSSELYSTTSFGGAQCSCGTVFRVRP